MNKPKTEADFLKAHAWKAQEKVEALTAEVNKHPPKSPERNSALSKRRRANKMLDECLAKLETLRVKYGINSTIKAPDSEPERKQEKKPEPQTEGNKEDDSNSTNTNGPAAVPAEKAPAPF